MFRQWNHDREPVIAALIQAIAQLPNSGAISEGPVVEGEFTDLSIQVLGKAVRLRIKTRKSIQLADVRGWLWQWQQSPLRDPDQLLMVASQWLPPGPRKLLGDQRIAFFDVEDGSLFIPAKDAYVFLGRLRLRRNSRAWRAHQWQLERDEQAKGLRRFRRSIPNPA
jgi:hypothetical protein